MFNKNISFSISGKSLETNERNFKTDLMNAFMDCELPWEKELFSNTFKNILVRWKLLYIYNVAEEPNSSAHSLAVSILRLMTRVATENPLK